MFQSAEPDTGSALRQFRTLGHQSAPPMLPDFLAVSSDADYLTELISLDLDYRWQKFQSVEASTRLGVDDAGFPRFPLLEDYVRLIGAPARSFLTPRLLAAEYRVRLRYGDQPSRLEYSKRFQMSTEDLAAEFDRVERDLLTAPTVVPAPDSVAMWDHSTAPHPASSPSDDQATASFTADDNPPSDEPPRIGKYQASRLLGKGGFGEVWLAEHPQLKRMVAIKIPRRDRRFSEAQLETFLHESRRLASLGLVPGVVVVYDADVSDGVPFIVSDFIDGQSLQQRLRRGPLPLVEGVEIVASVAQTLHRAHLRGLSHRDIKPGNILLDSQGKAYLTDFGLAATEHEQLHERPSTLGTCAFMSPEQARGDSHLVDGRTDIYSLGVVLYLVMTQRLPFVAEDTDAYLSQILSREPRPPRMIDDRIPEELERICLKALRKPVSDRYTVAGDMAADLLQWAAGSNSLPATDRRTWRPGLGAAGLGLVVAGLVWRFAPHREEPPSPFPSGPPVVVAGDKSAPPIRPQDERRETVVPASLIAGDLSGSGFFQVKEGTNRLHVGSDDLELIKLGTLGNDNAVIELSIEVNSLKSEFGHAGLFVGFRSDADPERMRFQMIRLQQQPDGSGLARRTTTSFDPRTPDGRASRDATPVPAQLAARVNIVRLIVANGRLRSVSWNGQVVEQQKGPEPDLRVENDLTGAFGVYVHKSVAVFSELRRDGELQVFRSSH